MNLVSPTSLPAIEELVSQRGIDFFLCSFVEMSGAPKAKLVPATHLHDLAEDGAGFAGFAAGEMGQGPHSPDMAAIPDFSSTTILPWRPGCGVGRGQYHRRRRALALLPAQHFANPTRTRGRGWATNSKPALNRNSSCSKAAAMALKPHDAMDILSKPCYDLRALNRNLDLMTTLLRHMQKLGWEPYANDHEDANCQFEINWTFSDALTTADRHVFFRWMVKTVAETHGLIATFMPKPFSHLTGNGCHVHQSLWDSASGENLFLDKDNENGLSATAYHFIGGPDGTRARFVGGVRADGEFLQAFGAWRAAFGRDVGASLRDLWRQQSHTNDSYSRRGTLGTARRRWRDEFVFGDRVLAGGGFGWD